METALREIAEECGVEVQNIQFQFLSNLTEYAPKHYCHIGLTAEWRSGEPQILEPDKCESWSWYSIDALPSPLFTACEQAIEAYKTGRNFFDKK
jgi:8-oxo-dGTP diphosphatase